MPAVLFQVGMMKKFLIALILFVEAFAAFSEGRKLYFIGTVKSESFPVDEFGGIGREENVWILQGKNKSEKRQLVFLNGKKDYDTYRPMLNQRVLVYGETMDWQNAHHKTPQLIIVDRMELFSTVGKTDLSYNEKKSFHNDVNFVDSIWLDQEYVCIKNNGNAPADFQIVASFEDDYLNAFIIQSELLGCTDKDGKETVFHIDANCEKIFTVYFIAESTELKRKSNRNPIKKKNLEIRKF